MSSSDSDSDNEHDRFPYWSHQCTRNDFCLDSYESKPSDDSLSDETSSEESIDEKLSLYQEVMFISIFNHKIQKNKTFISDAMEIQTYREKYKKLPVQNVKNIKRIWAEVKVDMPVRGQIPLKEIDSELIEDSIKNENVKKKTFKKPTHLIQKQLSSATLLNKSESSDTVSKFKKITEPEVKQANGKVPQAQINKENKKKPEIGKVIDVSTKANVIFKNMSNQNKNENNDKLVKMQIPKTNLKSNTDKTVGSNGNIPNTKPAVENFNKENISNTSNQKSNIESNSAKVNLIKTKVENKIEKNKVSIINNIPLISNKEKTGTVLPLAKKMEEKEKLEISKINSSTPNKKSVPEDKNIKVDKLSKSEVKTNVEKNKIEKTNLTNKKSNTENKAQRKDSINSNVESGEKNKNSNNSVNNKNSKADEAHFKIPESNEIIPLSKSNKKENTLVNQNLQLNKNDTFKKLSKKQEKKRRQREKKLEANNRDTSTCSSRDLSVSSTNSCNEKNSKNNFNINCNEKDDKPRKKQLTKSQKKTENNKSVESEQDTEESDAEEMDLLTDTEHLPTFIADIVKRKNKNKQPKVKPTPKTPIKNKGNKNSNNEKEKMKIENVQEITVNFKKNKFLHITDQNYSIYSDRYAEEGVEMILENNIMAALEYITVAIDCNPSDYRHYLNRSYCYLRMNQPTYALADVQYVIRLCTNIEQLFIANLRAGQAAYILKNYKQAEYFLKEATRINQESYHAQRELIRVKISHIMSLGFNEQDALMALQKYTSVSEAISYLNKNKKNLSISKIAIDSEVNAYNFDNMVFISDDEEETSNFQTLNRMLNYKPGKIKLQHLATKPVNFEKVLNKNGKPKTIPEPKKKFVNDKAIWVGNLTNNITDQMLKKKFK